MDLTLLSDDELLALRSKYEVIETKMNNMQLGLKIL